MRIIKIKIHTDNELHIVKIYVYNYMPKRTHTQDVVLIERHRISIVIINVNNFSYINICI